MWVLVAVRGELVCLRLKVYVGAGGYVNKPKIWYSSGPYLEVFTFELDLT